MGMMHPQQGMMMQQQQQQQQQPMGMMMVRKLLYCFPYARPPFVAQSARS